MSGRWHEAADAKLDLYKFWQSDAGRAIAWQHGRVISDGNPRSMAVYDHIAEIETGLMHRANAVYVAPEIMEIAREASKTFKPEPFLETDLITPCGFVLLPEALSVPDAQGKTVTIRALGWYPTWSSLDIDGEEQKKEGVWMSLYTHVDDLLLETDGEKLKKLHEDEQNVLGFRCPWVYLHGMMMPFGMSPEQWLANAMRKPGYTEESMKAGIETWWKFVQTLFRLSAQTLSVRESMTYERHQRKRLERAGLDTKEGTLVITLRRPRTRSDGESESSVEWKHQWIVGGFWRNHWYPKLKTHRQIWISDYVKGPEGLPLLIHPDKVYNFVK